MAKLYDEVTKHNSIETEADIHDLNVFFSRLLFCFFAEDTGVFEASSFTNAIGSYTQDSGEDTNTFLDQLFKVLDRDFDDREGVPEHLAGFGLELGDDQGRRPGDQDLEGAIVAALERGDRHRGVVDQRRLQAPRLARRHLVVRRDARGPPALARVADGVGNHQVDGYAVRADPASRLKVAEIEMKSCGLHRLLEERLAFERGGVHYDVAVPRLGRDRVVLEARVQVDRLCPDHDQGVPLTLQCLDRVDQPLAGAREQGRRLNHRSWPLGP